MATVFERQAEYPISDAEHDYFHRLAEQDVGRSMAGLVTSIGQATGAALFPVSAMVATQTQSLRDFSYVAGAGAAAMVTFGIAEALLVALRRLELIDNWRAAQTVNLANAPVRAPERNSSVNGQPSLPSPAVP